MTGFTGSLLAFILAISVLVAVHEFGHFWVAGLSGIKELRISIGFGKPLWRKNFGSDNTEFAIGMLPLGGYVKMLDEREAPVTQAEAPQAFNRKPLWVRNSVIAAGPVANFLFAIIAYWLMFVSGVPGLKPIVGETQAQSPAAIAGFREQDEILSVSGTATPTWDSVTLELLDAVLAQEIAEVEVRAVDDSRRLLVLNFSEVTDALDKGGLLHNLGLSVWRPRLPAVIDRLVEGAPADRAGIQPGDQVIAVDGETVADWSAWVKYVRARPGQSLQVTVQRGRDELEVELEPKPVEDNGTTIGQIGAYVHQPEDLGRNLRTEVRYGPLESISKSVDKTWEMSALTLRTLWSMVSGRASVENISGPISIAQYAAYSAQIGWASFLKFLAIVSISLGILNLLPVPVLDGGHLLYNLIEWLQGKPLSESAQMFGQQLGIFLLLLLMSVAFYNDLSRIFGS